MEAPNLNIHVDPKLMQQAERILSAIGVSSIPPAATSRKTTTPYCLK